MKNKWSIIFLAVFFGWLAGHVQSYFQHMKQAEDERFVLKESRAGNERTETVQVAWTI